MKIYSAVLISIIMGFGLQLQAQDFLKDSRVHGSFQIDGMYYQADEAIGISDSLIDGRVFGLNGFGNIIYNLGDFSAGFRYEAYMTPIAGFDPRLEGNGIPFFWATYNHDRFSVTAGNFYEQFGNGFAFRTYEEWALGYDNAMSGLRVTFDPVDGLRLKALYGSQRFFWAKFEKNSRGIVKGFDAELDFNRAFAAMADSRTRLIIGGSAVSKYQADNDPLFILPENVATFSGRMNLGLGRLNFLTEYAYKINDPSALNGFIYKEGQGLLASISYSTKGLGILLEAKRLDNMSFRSDRAETANALDINFLPPIAEIHTYLMTSFYPYATQLNGEMGMQAQVNYKVPKKSYLGGKYGMGIMVNFSQINDIVREPVEPGGTIGEAGTLGYKSDFFAVSDQVFFRDLNITLDKKFSKKFKGVLMYMNQLYDIDVLEGAKEKPRPIVHTNIAVLEATYKFTPTNSLRAELQGLWTQQDRGDWAVFLLEYTVAPTWFFTVLDQYNYGNPDEERRNHFYMANMGYTYRSTRIALGYGRVREGILCVGGVCRQVPASSGFTLTISSNF